MEIVLLGLAVVNVGCVLSLTMIGIKRGNRIKELEKEIEELTYELNSYDPLLTEGLPF